MVYGVLHESWVLHELVDRLPNVDGTLKYCQNASDVAVGSCTIRRRARPNGHFYGILAVFWYSIYIRKAVVADRYNPIAVITLLTTLELLRKEPPQGYLLV